MVNRHEDFFRTPFMCQKTMHNQPCPPQVMVEELVKPGKSNEEGGFANCTCDTQCFPPENSKESHNFKIQILL